MMLNARSLIRKLAGSREGQSIIEFAISLPFLVLMSMGTFAVGMMIDRHLTLTQVVRNGGNMFARGIDFSSSQNKKFIISAATGLELKLDGTGRSAVYFSKLTRVPANAVCDTGSGPRNCANNGKVVIQERYIIGKTSQANMASKLGMPTLFLDDSGQPAAEGEHSDHFDLPDAVATGAPAAIAGPGGILENEQIYVVEILHEPLSLSFSGIFSPAMIYTRGFF